MMVEIGLKRYYKYNHLCKTTFYFAYMQTTLSTFLWCNFMFMFSKMAKNKAALTMLELC